MTDPIQPPPGYTATPPTEAGWYRVWCDGFYNSPYRCKEVWQSRSCSGTGGRLCVDGPHLVDEIEDWFWGPKVEFP